MNSPEMTDNPTDRHGGQTVVDILMSHGVRHIFTLCGGHISPILVAAKESGIRVIDVRDEASSVFAADAVSRLSQTTGVAVVTSGPGLTNTITAVKNSQLAQSPIILIGGATATVLKNKGSLQDIDQLALLKPHIKWSATVRYVNELKSKLEAAFAAAQSGVPGPVFLEIPVDLLYPEQMVREWYKTTSGTKSRGLQDTLFNSYLRWHLKRLFSKGRQSSKTITFDAGFAPPSPGKLHRVATLLNKAERPVMLVGSQAMLSAAKAPAIQEAIRSMGIPTYLSGMARGLLAEDDHFYFRHKRKLALKESDLVILAGVPCDFRLNYGRHIPRSASLVSINRSRHDLRKNRRPDLGIPADPAEAILSLAEMSDGNQNREGWINTLRQRDNERRNEIESQAAIDTGLINPLNLCREINLHLDNNSILVADGGDFVATASYIIQPRSPLSWLDPGVFGTLGVGGGFALGAKLCHPEAEVWILYGDGAAGFSLAEFDTFVRHNLPVIAVVGNDAGWSQIAREQVEMLGDEVGTALAYTNYHKVAEGYGGVGLSVQSSAELPNVLKRAKATVWEGKPVLVNALIGKTDFRKGSISM